MKNAAWFAERAKHIRLCGQQIGWWQASFFCLSFITRIFWQGVPGLQSVSLTVPTRNLLTKTWHGDSILLLGDCRIEVWKNAISTQYFARLNPKSFCNFNFVFCWDCSEVSQVGLKFAVCYVIKANIELLSLLIPLPQSPKVKITDKIELGY